jgi:hypothetical protein
MTVNTRNSPRPGLGDRIRWRVDVPGLHEDYELEREGTITYVLSKQYVVEADDHTTYIVRPEEIKT